MTEILLSVLFSVFLFGYFFVTDLAVSLAPAGTCQSLPRRFIIPFAAAVLFLGVFFQIKLNPLPLLPERDIIILSSLAAALIFKVSLGHASIIFAVSGAAAGVLIMQTGNPSLEWRQPLSWISAMIMTSLLSMLFCRIFSVAQCRSESHLLSYMDKMGKIVTLAAALFLLGIGFNSGSLLASFLSDEIHPIYFGLVFLALALFLKSAFEVESGKMQDTFFDIKAGSAAAVILASALVLFLFSFEGIVENVGLKAVPLSPGLLVFSGLAGCSIAQGREINWSYTALRAGVDMFIVPALAFIFACIIYGLAHPHSLGIVNMQAAVLTLLLIIVAIGFFAMFLFYRGKSRTSVKALKAQEEELYRNKKAINELEIRTMQAENENLHNLLQLKREELISMAMNMGEQKEFIRVMYEKVKEAINETDLDKKDALLYEMRTDLNLRNNYSGELDNFYAEVEKLHKDFTTRMTEKHPQLTKQERRLTILLRLGFSTKYIAALMNIAPSSVEIGRHRLRSKFGLGRGRSLTEYIKTI